MTHFRKLTQLTPPHEIAEVPNCNKIAVTK